MCVDTDRQLQHKIWQAGTESGLQFECNPWSVWQIQLKAKNTLEVDTNDETYILDVLSCVNDKHFVIILMISIIWSGVW